MYKNKTLWYSIGTNEVVQYLNDTLNSILLHYNHTNNRVVNSHV